MPGRNCDRFADVDDWPKDRVLNVKFSQKLFNGDTIATYLTGGDNTDIIIFNDSSMEPQPNGYGQVPFAGVQGWYNITLAGLSEPRSLFNIDPLNVDFDYVEKILWVHFRS